MGSQKSGITQIPLGSTAPITVNIGLNKQCVHFLFTSTNGNGDIRCNGLAINPNAGTKPVQAVQVEDLGNGQGNCASGEVVLALGDKNMVISITSISPTGDMIINPETNNYLNASQLFWTALE